jgi:hypothetical protein
VEVPTIRKSFEKQAIFFYEEIGQWWFRQWEEGVFMKCPACDQVLKRVEGLCGEYICINTECLENKKANLHSLAEFYGLTQEDIDANYRLSITKK